ncbi:MAG TPA: FAD-dependent oxidoreductase [Tepidisphaeraceae bacterium]|nr:FAD-dependent oxidoreductase [Tepidisphaeraceae bacterium]
MSEEKRRADVIVVGAGIIGAACADALARCGARVIVLDRHSIGYGCSFGNAGWLTPCFALPLPVPGMLMKSIGWLLDPRGPLYIKPEADLNLIRWLGRFLLSMTNRLFQQSVRALVELSRRSMEMYRELDAASPGCFSMKGGGLLIVAQTQEGLTSAIHEKEAVASHGVPGEILDHDAVCQLEPAIIGSNIAGGVYFPQEAHCEPLAAVQALADRAKRNGTVFVENAEVYDFEYDNSKIDGLHTTAGFFRADQYVLATGAWSGALGRKLGMYIPMRSGKGYSITVEHFENEPRIPLMLIEKKCAVTPRSVGLKLAGTLELVGLDDSLNTSRMRAILAGAAQYIELPSKPVKLEVWRGLRPCTPDGVPIIGRPHPDSNMVIAAGHQMLGLQTAPATGALVSDLIAKTVPQFDPAPFCATRFMGGRRKRSYENSFHGKRAVVH